jgi:hypothetical protein
LAEAVVEQGVLLDQTAIVTINGQVEVVEAVQGAVLQLL